MTLLPRDLGEADAGFAVQDLGKIRDNPKKEVAVSQLHSGAYAAVVTLKGELTTDGIAFSQHEKFGDKYSLGIRLESEEDRAAILGLVDMLDEAIGDDDDVEWETASPYRDDSDVLYLKCKTNRDQSAFAFTSNLKLNPKKGNTEIFRYMPLEVQVMIGAYFNVTQNTRGIYFTIRHIEFKKPGDTRDASTQTEPAQDVAERAPRRVGGSGPGAAARRGNRK